MFLLLCLCGKMGENLEKKIKASWAQTLRSFIWVFDGYYMLLASVVVLAKVFKIALNPKWCGVFDQLRMRGGMVASLKCPVRDSRLWMLQFLSQINKQYRIWKLTSSAKIWDLSEVTEASGCLGSDQGQNKKILGENSKIVSLWPKKC